MSALMPGHRLHICKSNQSINQSIKYSSDTTQHIGEAHRELNTNHKKAQDTSGFLFDDILQGQVPNKPNELLHHAKQGT